METATHMQMYVHIQPHLTPWNVCPRARLRITYSPFRIRRSCVRVVQGTRHEAMGKAELEFPLSPTSIHPHRQIDRVILDAQPRWYVKTTYS